MMQSVTNSRLRVAESPLREHTHTPESGSAPLRNIGIIKDQSVSDMIELHIDIFQHKVPFSQMIGKCASGQAANNGREHAGNLIDSFRDRN